MDALPGFRKKIEEKRQLMIDMQRDLTAVPALGPQNGGTGEWQKAEVLTRWISKLGLGPCRMHPVDDARVPEGKRPNLSVSLPGRGADGTFWIMTHLDIVPPGDEKLWKSDPYTLLVDGDTLVGRGVEDNQQSLVASVIAASCINELGLIPARTVKLLFVADEETGSEHGIGRLVRSAGLFGPHDHALVPDSGSKDGAQIEIAEKSILWLRFRVLGRQCHASVPHRGANAFEAGSHLIVRLGRLQEKFAARDALFDPPTSTFTPTRKEANVPNINTIPGEDVFYFDCRILPAEDLDAVLETVREICRGLERDFGVGVGVDEVQRASSPPTAADSPLVTSLARAIRAVYGVEAKTVGIGGGTVGAFLRRQGIPTVVWSRVEETAHMPNERCLVSNMMGDAAVMAALMLEN